MKVGSLFTGYGGLDIAVGGDLAWYSEIDKPACKVLQTHHPNVTNLGDITKIDWAQVEPVDVITGGYPCQPFSHAGLRKGKNDERHLWPYVRDAIDALRPRYAILENVSGHLTLGFGDVLADLATIGYDAEWGIIRASDVGAPHQRKRLFIIAYPSCGTGGAWQGWGISEPEGTAGLATRSGSVANANGSGQQTPNNERPRDGHTRRSQPMERGGSVTKNTNSIRGRETKPSTPLLDTERNIGTVRPVGSNSGTTTDTGSERHGCRQNTTMVGGMDGENRGTRGQSQHNSASIEWGKYTAAIRRWERTIERPAPNPTIWHKDRQRLNPVFVEWMMGLDEGHVTGHGLSSAQELKMLGNGVVPQQARAAINQLLERITP